MNINNGEVWSRPQANVTSEAGTATEEKESPTTIFCPRCMTHQLAEATAKEIYYKQCPHCGGMWFNINELEKALGNKVKFAMPEGTVPEKFSTHSLKPTCPTCNVHLIHINALETPELAVEACVICQGRWVDGSEIAQFQNRGLFAQIKNFVISLF